jgi:hypothetical protein
MNIDARDGETFRELCEKAPVKPEIFDFEGTNPDVARVDQWYASAKGGLEQALLTSSGQVHDRSPDFRINLIAWRRIILVAAKSEIMRLQHMHHGAEVGNWQRFSHRPSLSPDA